MLFKIKTNVVFYVMVWFTFQVYYGKCENARGNGNQQCHGETCDSVCRKKDNIETETFSFLDIRSEWENGDITETRNWLSKNILAGYFSTCKTESNEKLEKIHKDNPVLVIERLYDCPKEGSYTKYTGPMDSNMLPKGRGTFELLGTPDRAMRPGQPCFSLMHGIRNVHSKFKNGLPNGPGKITYSDGSILDGHFKDGVLYGVGKLYNAALSAEKELQLIGYFVGGRLHGPAWILMPTKSEKSNLENEGAVMIYFEHGRIGHNNNVVYVPGSGAFAYSGNLSDQFILTDTLRYEISHVTSWQCITLVDKASNSCKKGSEPLRLPVKIIPDPEMGRVYIHNSQIIFFNPTARTGTETFMWLLHKLKSKKQSSFKIHMSSPTQNRLRTAPKTKFMESYDDVHKVTKEILMEKRPTVYAKPYNFIDFNKHGSLWSPDYFSIVRDPIEKVVSWFYHKRSASHIIENKLKYPNERLPDPDSLKKNFNNCVMDGDDECTFIQGEDSIGRGDHRGQMMAFCGHEDWCSEFNSQRVFQRAKLNIEKNYPVVGVLEDMNKTLAVLEHRYPNILTGALEVYEDYKIIHDSNVKFGENQFKLPITTEAMEEIKPDFDIEYEFYEFCKQRLDEQYEAIKTSQHDMP